jgi:hypothetical protein
VQRIADGVAQLEDPVEDVFVEERKGEQDLVEDVEA